MKKSSMLLLGGAAAVAYSHRKEIGHFFVGTLARTEERVRGAAGSVWNMGKGFTGGWSGGSDEEVDAAEDSAEEAEAPEESDADAEEEEVVDAI